MRLAALLAELLPEQLERLASAHLREDESIASSTLLATLESVLRSYSFVRQVLVDRFPPAFAIFETLLESEDYAFPAEGFRAVVTERTSRLVEAVSTGELVGRDDGLRLYRRVLLEARRSDLRLDASEAAILGVLRHELGIRPVEHFLIEHHPDFHRYWAKDIAFLDEMNVLRSSGLVFGHQGRILLAEEVVPLVRQALGLEMSHSSRGRLFELLSAGDMGQVLADCGLKVGGSKEERLARLLSSYVQPTEVLRTMPLQAVRELCRGSNARVAGAKDELVERLVSHFLHNLDVREGAADSERVIPQEPRALDGTRFRGLFAALKGDELTDILAAIESSRITGAKESKIAILLESPYSEATLLEKTTNRALEDALGRLRLRPNGPKRDRIERLVEYFRLAPIETLELEPDGVLPAPPGLAATVAPPAKPDPA